MSRLTLRPYFFRRFQTVMRLTPRIRAASSLDSIKSYINGYENSEELYEDLEAAYVTLFISAKDGTTASLYHSYYDSQDGLLMGRPAKMMAGYLERAGLKLGEDKESEPKDHLAVEVEYLLFLLESAWSREDEALENEAYLFVSNELLPFAKRVSEELNGAPENPIFPASARLLVSLLERILALPK